MQTSTVIGTVSIVLLVASACTSANPGGGDTRDAQVKSTASALTANLSATADTRLAENWPTTRYGSAVTLQVDGDSPDSSGKDSRVVLMWNVSSIPAGSQVTAASVSIYIPSDSSTDPFYAYEMKRPWVESAANWHEYAAGLTWQIPGARGVNDAGGVELGTLAPAGATGWSTFALNPAGVSLVQSWINGAANHGIVLAHDTSANGIVLASREYPQAARLEVTYGAPATCGDGTCQSSEDSFSCSVDCPGSCNGCLHDLDYDSDLASQWGRLDQFAPDRITQVAAPRRQGNFAGRFQVVDGDLVKNGERAEIMLCPGGQCTFDPEGTERWYGWSTYWPTDYPWHPSWQVFTQWHHVGNTGIPPIEFYLYDRVMHLATMNPSGTDLLVQWTQTLTPGIWHDFIFHVKFSNDPQVGFVELWLDGVNVLPRTSARTMRDAGNILRQGLYRDRDIAPNGTIYHDNMRVGRTRQEIE